MKTIDKITDTGIKIGVIIAILVGALTKQQYSYYNFLRWLIFTTSIYFIYKSALNNLKGLVIYFVVLGILFNPFDKFWFQKETWHLIDYVTAFILAITIIFDWKPKSN